MFPHNVIIGILYYLPESNLRFDSRMGQRQRFFYDMKDLYPDIFSEFKFDTRDYTPYCETLECVVDDLMLGGTLWYAGVRSEALEFSKCFVKSFYEQNIKSKLVERERKALEDCAEYFQNVLVI